MHLIFSTFLDGAPWSDKDSSFGEARLGPKGTLALLETHLGLSAPAVHPARRINEYLARVDADDSAEKWHHRSFQVDPWSTARQLLSWRDQLKAGGWEGGAFTGESVSPRLESLAALETAASPLSEGFEDRLQMVLKCLEKTESLPLSSVELLDKREFLPPIWQKIWNRAEALGVSVRDHSGISIKQNSVSTLASVQTALLSENTQKRAAAGKDDSLLFLEAGDEWQAAETLALWLANGGKESNADVVIIAGSDTEILDEALRRQGLPQLGVLPVSRWRSALQILPLALANAWEPIDVQRLAELLAMPTGPVPRYAARDLLQALNEEPGIGGKAWKSALEKIIKERARRSMERIAKRSGVTVEENSIPIEPAPEVLKEAELFTEDLNAMLAGERCSPEDGIPEAVLQKRCQWVIERLALFIEMNDSDVADMSLLKGAMAQAREVQSLASGKKILPRVLVDRMLDAVIGEGSSNPAKRQQAAPWTVVTHPGRMVNAVGTVIWWGFADTSSPSENYWSVKERDVLLKNGVILEDSSWPRQREAQAWRRALFCARERLMLFFPKQKNGSEQAYHPFWDEIISIADIEKTGIIHTCADLYKDANWKLAGRSAVLVPAERRESESPVTQTYSVPSGLVKLPKSLSYSQMSAGIGCPMNWTLAHHAGLKGMDALTLPTGSRMTGTLCHRIVHEIYTAAPAVSAGDAARKAAGLYDELLPSMASELLLEGRELERRRLKTAIVHAVEDLAGKITGLGLTVEKSEEELNRGLKTSGEEIPFTGYADLVLRTLSGDAFILDMKWSAYGTYKKAEVENGDALQLAAYAWLLKSAGSGKQEGNIHTGYYMLAQRELLSDSPLLGKEALPSRRSLDEIWNSGKRAWEKDFENLSSGIIEAKGVKEKFLAAENGLKEEKLREKLSGEAAEQGLLYIRPPCGFCDFKIICALDKAGAGAAAATVAGEAS
jgi:RecB family exonuclease